MRSVIKAAMKRSILSNISFNFLIKVITYLFSFLTVLYVARVLQPEIYGKISFCASFTGYFVLLARLGMPTYAMRSCAERRNNRTELNRIFNELFSINVLLSIASAIILLLTITLIPRLDENRVLLLIFGSTIIFQMIGCEWLFKALEEFRFLAVSTFICKLVSFICILIFVRTEGHAVRYALLSVLTSSGSNAVCFITLRQHVDITFPKRINTEHFKPLLIFFLMSCAVSIYSSLDLTMLGFMKTDYETGLYSLTAKGKEVLTMTGGLVWSSALPMAAGLWKEGKRKQFESLAAKSLAGVCAVQSAATIFCMIFAKQLILIAGGESYLRAVGAFRILLLSLIPTGASNIIGGQVLIPAGLERRLLRAEIAGAVFNFIANLIIIPYLSFTGAAITTSVSEIIVLIICIYYAKKDLDMDFSIGFIKKAINRIRSEWYILRIRAVSRIKGNKLPFYCPCCDTHLKNFINGGYDKKPELYNSSRYEGIDQEVICPICGSLPRHRILAEWLNNNIEAVKNKEILHFAQEKSLKLWEDRNHIKYVTADIYNPADMKLDIEDTGLDKESCDCIICNHIMEHVPDYRKALEELHRIIRPDGLIIISFPIDPTYDTVYEDKSITSAEERIECFGQYDHLRVFGRDSITLLQKSGFAVEEITGKESSKRIKPVVGPGNYDYDGIFLMHINSYF